MPFIQVKLIEKVFTPEQKKKIITKITDALVEIEGEHMRPVTFVVIDETRSGDWGIGGQPMTTEAVLALAAGKKVAA
jgi:4-oxalocrotonate tautomerase